VTVRSVVLGCGSYLPKRILTNAELATRIDTSDEWIVQRTGIRQRHIAADDEFTSHLGINAAKAALADAGLDAQAIDLIVLATSTPDNTFPATAVAVQHSLGITVSSPRICVRTAGTSRSSTWMVGLDPPRRWAICEWKAARFSNTPWA